MIEYMCRRKFKKLQRKYFLHKCDNKVTELDTGGEIYYSGSIPDFIHYVIHKKVCILTTKKILKYFKSYSGNVKFISCGNTNIHDANDCYLLFNTKQDFLKWKLKQ